MSEHRLFTSFYNIKRRGYAMELQEESFGTRKGRSHETVIGKLMELGIQGVIKLEDHQLTFIERCLQAKSQEIK